METVREARDRYLRENGFSTSAYTEPTFRVSGIPLAFPNTEGRKRVIALHDLHHVATGYGTDFAGEAEIGAWELRAGCSTAAAYFLNGMAALFGLVIAPRRTVRAWKTARGAVSLYRLNLTADELLDLPVPELRKRVKVPEQGVADRPPALHRSAPAR